MGSNNNRVDFLLFFCYNSVPRGDYMNVIFLDFNGVLDTYENMDVIDSNN